MDNITVNGIEYTVTGDDVNSVISWANGIHYSSGGVRDAIKHLVLVGLRKERDKELRDSDWRTTSDYPYDDRDAWIEYRDGLRKFTDDYEHGVDISLPTKP